MYFWIWSKPSSISSLGNIDVSEEDKSPASHQQKVPWADALKARLQGLSLADVSDRLWNDFVELKKILKLRYNRKLKQRQRKENVPL